MSKRIINVSLVTAVLSIFIFTGTARTLQTQTRATEDWRTVLANAKGEKVTITKDQHTYGKKLFYVTCGECHAGGTTIGSETTTLSAKHLAEAIPKRNNIEGLVDYMKNPTTADGETEISELHPSKKSQDIFTSMRTLSDDDLFKIAGYILCQANNPSITWGPVSPY